MSEFEAHVCAALRHLARAAAQEAATAEARRGVGASRGQVHFESLTCPGVVCNTTNDGGSPRPGSRSGSASSAESEDTYFSKESAGSITDGFVSLATARLENSDDALLPRTGGSMRREGPHGKTEEPGKSAAAAAAAAVLEAGHGVPAGNYAVYGTEAPQATAARSKESLQLGSAFQPFLHQLLELVWAFFLRARLVDALLRGDAMLAAGWSMRLLGVGVGVGQVGSRWSLMRLQELLVHLLELTVESPGGCKASGAAGSGLVALQLFHDACRFYLQVPIIPRYKARVRRCISSLTNLGILGLSGPSNGPASPRTLVPAPPAGLAVSAVAAMDDDDRTTTTPSGRSIVRRRRTLEEVLSAFLDPAVDESAAGGGFSHVEKNLEIVRKEDAVHEAARRALADAAISHGLKGRCLLDCGSLVIVGAEAASLMQGNQVLGRRLSAVLPSVPEPIGMDPAKLRAPTLGFAGSEDIAELANILDDDSSEEWPNMASIGVEDVMFDFAAERRATKEGSRPSRVLEDEQQGSGTCGNTRSGSPADSGSPWQKFCCSPMTPRLQQQYCPPGQTPPATPAPAPPPPPASQPSPPLTPPPPTMSTSTLATSSPYCERETLAVASPHGRTWEAVNAVKFDGAAAGCTEWRGSDQV